MNSNAYTNISERVAAITADQERRIAALERALTDLRRTTMAPVEVCKLAAAAFAVPDATNTTVNAFSDVHDPGGIGGVSTITIPTDGVYLVTVNVDWPSTFADGVRTVVYVSLAGSGAFAQVDTAQGAASVTPGQSLAEIHPFSAGNQLSVVLWQNAGASKNANVTFSAVKIAD